MDSNGRELLSAWFESQIDNNKEMTPLFLCEADLKILGKFFLSSPKTGSKLNDKLMNRENISNVCDNIIFYIENKKHLEC